MLKKTPQKPLAREVKTFVDIWPEKLKLWWKYSLLFDKHSPNIRITSNNFFLVFKPNSRKKLANYVFFL